MQIVPKYLKLGVTGRRGSQSVSLIFTAVTCATAGQYMCRVKVRGKGETVEQASLQVTGKKHAYTRVRACVCVCVCVCVCPECVWAWG